MNLKIKGYVENRCRRCGKLFKVVYYEGEDESAAKKDYCLCCILGVEEKDIEGLLKAK